MRVLLINPRAQKAHRRLPLSVLFVARNLPDDIDWQIIDANIMPDAQLRAEAVIAADPGGTVLMVTVMPGPQLRWAVPWCRSLKARWPTLRIVWGGYFPSVYPEVVCRDAAVDYVVFNQGEDTARELVCALRDGVDPAGMAGVALWRGGQLVQGPPRRWKMSSRYPDPPYERLPMEAYAAKTFLGKRTYNHHSSVGCPYTCNFCAVTTVAQGRWIADPPEDVVRISRQLVTQYGADAIEFHDNNFFAAEKRCREIARGLAPLGVRWWGEGRIDTMLDWSDQTWSAMARGGLKMVFYGAESGDPEALEAMNKGGLEVRQTIELNLRSQSYGIIPEFSFVVGNPEDPERDIEATLKLVQRLKQDNSDCEIILYVYTPVPLPGMYDEAVAQGFAFPETLDEWLGPQWAEYESRRQPVTPWLTTGMVRRVYDFESVLHARWPSVSDRNLRSWQRGVLRLLGAPRYQMKMYARPYGIRALQRVWGYRRPEEMGF
ncbi:MAG: anaerobic magnesium-protoporphyrin IX monomethyl ester cyclase [Myxococcota bacterium]|jgi:anaerobic magnesium-protoporphyrin IX monomethyl ester cyclase